MLKTENIAVRPRGIAVKINNSQDFGKMLRKRRKQLGYTQKYLSDFTGFSVSFISDLENGKETIEIGRAFKLANTLGLDIELNERGTYK